MCGCVAHCVGLPPAPTYSPVPYETGCCARKQAASTAACRNGDTPHSTVLRPKSIHTDLGLSPEVESVFQAELLPPQASAGYWSARPPPGTRRCTELAQNCPLNDTLLCSAVLLLSLQVFPQFLHPANATGPGASSLWVKYDVIC